MKWGNAQKKQLQHSPLQFWLTLTPAAPAAAAGVPAQALQKMQERSTSVLWQQCLQLLSYATWSVLL